MSLRIKKKLFLYTFFIIVYSFFFVLFSAHNDIELEYVSFPTKTKIIKSDPKILLVRSTKNWGGVPKYTLILYRELLKLGYNVELLVPKGSYMQNELIKAKLPHFAACIGDCLGSDDIRLFMSMYRIYKLKKINIIHINKERELRAAQKLANIFDISIVAQHHTYSNPNPTVFADVAAFTSTSPDVTHFMTRKNKECGLNINCIEFIPPPAIDDQFLTFVPRYDGKDSFFKSVFNIDVQNRPVICMLANFYPCKNHEFLFKAVNKLMYEYKIPVHVVLAGDASPQRQEQLIRLATDLGIENNIHFLGFINNVAELLYYSDIKVLPSTGEAFAMVVLEAAFMKKPVVLSKAAGSANRVIIHEKTGLLFDPKNVDEFAAQMKRLIEDKAFAQLVGQNAFDLVVNKFSDRALAQSYASLYMKVYEQKIRKNGRTKLKGA